MEIKMWGKKKNSLEFLGKSEKNWKFLIITRPDKILMKFPELK